MDAVLAALEAIENQGAFSADKNISVDNFDINVTKIGILNFPINEDQIKLLINIAQPAKFGWRDQTILDPNVRKVFEIPANKIKIGKKQWSKKIEPLLNDFKRELGLPTQSKLLSELHNMLIYQSGDFFKPHQDTEKVDRMVATLVVILPTEHQGGELIIDHRGSKKTYALKKSKTPKLSCIAFYADCYHEVKEVLSGYRVSLTYNLILDKYKGSVDTLYESDTSKRLTQSVGNYFTPNQAQSERNKALKLIYLLDHQYTQNGLSWDSLKNIDRVRVEELLQIADRLNLEAHLVLADMKETWECESDYGNYRYRNRYHDDAPDEEEGSPVYIMDTETTLRHWMNREGLTVNYKDFTPSSREMCWTGANENFEPYESEYEGWMGNYGNTLDRWYHRAAIVLWRKEDYYPILFEMDQDCFIKEIFSLMASGTQLSTLQNMLHQTATYWSRFARKHQTDDDITNVMQLALYVNNSDISQRLLTSYELSIFNVKTITSWIELVNAYGSKWCLDVLEFMVKEKFRTGNTVISGCYEIILALFNKLDDRTIIDWLLNHQLMALQKEHNQYLNNRKYNLSNAPKRNAEIIDFMMATIGAGHKEIHLTMLTFLMNNKAIYQPLLLLELFEKCVHLLKKSELPVWGYPAFFDYLREDITREYQLGLRNKDDWSIHDVSGHSCAECKILNQFLVQVNEKEKIWPLSENSRSHIESQISSLDIPVNSRTEKTGRPYKLILTKNDKLYANAIGRYEAMQQAKVKLDEIGQFII